MGVHPAFQPSEALEELSKALAQWEAIKIALAVLIEKDNMASIDYAIHKLVEAAQTHAFISGYEEGCKKVLGIVQGVEFKFPDL